MNVALYARCSTKKQDMDYQLQTLRNWATKYERKIVFEFSDFAISGKKDDRAGILALLKEAENNSFEVIAVTEISRLGRSVSFIHKVIEDLSKKGIKIVLINSNTTLDYNSLVGRALIGGLALAADIEWMLIKERNERGRRAIKEKGIKLGRKHKVVSDVVLKSLLEKGMSFRLIGKEMGVSAPTIIRRVNEIKKQLLVT